MTAPDEPCVCDSEFDAEQRAHEEYERTRYESHAWNPGEDDDECVACGVTWQDCDDECPGVTA